MRTAVVRKESAGSQVYEPHKQKGMDMDVNENEDDLRFVPSASIRFAGPREPGFKCDGRCQREGFKCWDIAAETVEASGELDTCARVATTGGVQRRLSR